MADNLTTPVAPGSIIAAKDVAGVKFPWNLLADTAGLDAMGLVTASPAANTLLGRLKAIADSSAAAIPAGENYVGKIGGDVLSASAAPVVTTAPYAAGNVIGGKLTFANAARVATGAGLVQAASILSKSVQTGAVDLLMFAADPTATTFTDHAALAIDAADLSKLVGVIHITDWTALGSAALAQALNVGLPFKPGAGTSLFGVLVARSAITLASTSDLTASLRIIPG